MQFKEIKGEILNTHIINPIHYNYNDIIFQLEVQTEEGWMAQLMFEPKQILKIMREFDVRFLPEIHLKECLLLEDKDYPNKVPIGVKHKEDSEYIQTQNEFFSYLWK